MDAPKACWCWLHLVSTRSSCTQSLHKFRPQSEVIQKQIPGSRQFQRLHGIPQDMKHDLSILCRHRKDAQHCIFTHCSFLSGGYSPTLSMLWISSLPMAPSQLSYTSTHSTAHKNVGASSSAKPYQKLPAWKDPAPLLPGRQTCRLIRPKWQEHLP